MKQHLQSFLQPLSAAESAALLRALSDLESGSPRQWLLLEIAATLGAPESSRRTQVVAWLADWFGVAPCLPLLRRWQVPGVALYQANADKLGRCARRALDDASLFLVSVCALLAGFDRLPASRQFAVCLLLIFGGALRYWRTAKQHPRTPLPEVTGEEALPGAESALGLQGLLLARGVPALDAHTQLASFRTAPTEKLPDLLKALPELHLPEPEQGAFIRAALLGWCGALLPALWLNGWQWGWLISVVWVAGLAWLVHRRKTFVALLPGLALVSYVLARVAH